MRIELVLSLIAIGLVLSVTTPASAEETPAMKACSDDWNKMKKAGKTPKGQTWPEFWSQCSQEYAAKHGDANAVEPNKISSKPAAEVEDTANASDQKKACDTKWDDQKAKTGAHGWKAYFTFMAKCM